MWEEYYSNLEELPHWLTQPASFVLEAFPNLRDHRVKRVLDLGCGAGRHCLLLAKKKLEAVGVDLSVTALKISKELSQKDQMNIALACASMTRLPFSDSTFDAVISVSVIHHALRKDIAATIHEVHRVLKKNGFFLANLTSIKDPRYGTGQKMEDHTYRILEAFTGAEELHHFFNRKEIRRLLTSFAEVKVELSDEEPHYWTIMSKK